MLSKIKVFFFSYIFYIFMCSYAVFKALKLPYVCTVHSCAERGWKWKKKKGGKKKCHSILWASLFCVQYTIQHMHWIRSLSKQKQQNVYVFMLSLLVNSFAFCDCVCACFGKSWLKLNGKCIHNRIQPVQYKPLYVGSWVFAKMLQSTGYHCSLIWHSI